MKKIKILLKTLTILSKFKNNNVKSVNIHE